MFKFRPITPFTLKISFVYSWITGSDWLVNSYALLRNKVRFLVVYIKEINNINRLPSPVLTYVYNYILNNNDILENILLWIWRDMSLHHIWDHQ